MDMNLAVEDYEGLEQPEIVREAHERWDRAKVRLAQASEAVTAADQAEVEAWKREKEDMRTHITGEGDVDPMANAALVTEAGTRAAFARRLKAEAEIIVNETFSDIKASVGRSLAKVHARAVEIRIEAARDADVAREAMAEAEEKSRRATAQLERIYAAGGTRKFGGQYLHVPVRTEKAEREIWEHGVA